MTNQEAIESLREDYCCNRVVCELHSNNLCQTDKCEIWMAISALEEQEEKNSKESSPTHIALDTISRQEAIDALKDWYDGMIISSFRGVEKVIKALPSAQPEPLLDEIVDEIRKTIAETESNGKCHADPVRHNGEMICHGLQIALNIIEEKRNERSD